MLVSLKAKGREEFVVETTSEPVFSYAIFGGAEKAEIACKFDDARYVNALGGELHIHGSGWRGIVTRRPGRDEPLLAKGLGCVAGWNRDAATFTDVHVSDAADDILDEIDTDYLPAGAAYRAWMSVCDTHVTIPFSAVSAEAKFAELVKYAPCAYGWYPEIVANTSRLLPHLNAISTTPDYILKLDECEGRPDLEEAALDELVSAILVTYDGGTVAVTDTDATHPLVQLGLTRYGDLSVSTTVEATATACGQVALSERGRRQVKGTVTTCKLLTATGAECYLPHVRPGRMVRVYGLPGGQNDTIIKRITLKGDTLATIELDNEPYALDIMLARLNS